MSKFFYNLIIIVWESSLEYLVNVWLRQLVITSQLRVKTFLDNVAGELQLTQSNEVFRNLLENTLILLPILELDYILDQVVTVWVLNQLMNVIDDVVRQFQFLSTRSLLEASLHNTASMLVLSDWDTVVNAGLENEISVLTSLVTAKIVLVLWSLRCLEHHKKRLNHMVTVHINS